MSEEANLKPSRHGRMGLHQLAPHIVGNHSHSEPYEGDNALEHSLFQTDLAPFS